MANLFNQESNGQYKTSCWSQPPNKTWFLLFGGLKSVEKMYLALFASNGYLPQINTNISYKKDEVAVNEAEKSAQITKDTQYSNCILRG